MFRTRCAGIPQTLSKCLYSFAFQASIVNSSRVDTSLDTFISGHLLHALQPLPVSFDGLTFNAGTMQLHLPLQRHADADHNASCAKRPLFQCPRRVHPWRSRLLTQPVRAHKAQSNARSSMPRPSLDLKELEKLEANLLKDATSSSNSTADERIAIIKPPSASGLSSSPKKAWEKGKQPRTASAGPVRLRGAKGRKQGKDMTERLSKVIARAGIASRRRAEDLITAGNVKVNGSVVTVPQHPVLLSGADKISVHGKELPRATQPFYFAVNKPKGYLCANAPNKEGTTKLVVDLFEEWQASWKERHQHPSAVVPRLFTVGRLDVASTGLIFVTNDGVWAQKVLHPSSGLTKEYVVTCSQEPSRRDLEKVAGGCEVDGAFVTPVAVAPVKDSGRKPGIRIVIAEGRNREVRTLVANAGLDVEALKRVRIGGFRLPRSLGIGQHVALKPNEIRRIMDIGAQTNNEAINPFFAAYAL